MRESHKIILRPIITEKSNILKETRNQLVFEVARDANKIAIRKADQHHVRQGQALGPKVWQAQELEEGRGQAARGGLGGLLRGSVGKLDCEDVYGTQEI